MSIYQISVETADQQKVTLEKYRGQVLLIVNTATKCMFTPQYEGLQSLYDQFHERGFEILDFPCNQFANQAPQSDEEIAKFCSLEYKTTFPRFAKTNVNGPDENLLFTMLKKSLGGFLSPRIKWNFTKFLVDRNGKMVRRYGPNVKPTRIARDIEKIL
ncbi:MAG: glutathione peroxidase [Bacilli bacterium]|jgi:glutathione peroxidase|nr:glutathione peroxidase [Bacilli bacterium]MDD4005905.1 glutathione peroxidase [Bacilli bacterium]